MMPTLFYTPLAPYIFKAKSQILLTCRSAGKLLTASAALLLITSLTTLCAQELQKIGFLPYSAANSLSGCWHHVDSAGGEWALVGTKFGLSVVDVRDPFQPAERFLVPGSTNNWREVRTWSGFAYAGSEAPGSGITIVDLRNLPDTIYWKTWLGDGIYDSLVLQSHTVQTEAGFLYVFGGGTVTDGATIADLSDPWNPVIVGKYTQNYVHDGFIQGDTLWTSEIKKGWFGVVDISDKSNPVLLATQPTPGAFCHNSGLSDDGKTLFTTDEKSGAPLASFDVSNLENITLLDTYFPSKKPAGEVHNVRVLNDFLINPSYKGQLTIVDATRPANLIETAWDSVGNSLVWDADPYLPSGIILATEKAKGLFIYKKPAYRHAAWLEGRVTDGITGFSLANAKVFVTGTPYADTSGANGLYKTGAADPGLYHVYAFRNGYLPKNISGIPLKTNEVTTLDITLFPGLAAPGAGTSDLVRVSPSPFEDFLLINFPEGSPFREPGTTLRLFDIAGKLLMEKMADAGDTTLIQHLQHLPKGVYLLLATSATGTDKGVLVVK